MSAYCLILTYYETHQIKSLADEWVEGEGYEMNNE